MKCSFVFFKIILTFWMGKLWDIKLQNSWYFRSSSSFFPFANNGIKTASNVFQYFWKIASDLFIFNWFQVKRRLNNNEGNLLMARIIIVFIISFLALLFGLVWSFWVKFRDQLLKICEILAFVTGPSFCDLFLMYSHERSISDFSLLSVTNCFLELSILRLDFNNLIRLLIFWIS